ncbi:MAG: SHD1 domain-containing protein [Planctomycetota bacterium]
MRDAWECRGDETYPEKAFWRHYLAQITVEQHSSWNDGKDIHWIVEGREGVDRARDEKVRKVAEEAAKWRTWTDLKGRTIDAKFGGMIAGKVKLVKKDGSTVEILTEKLSDENQEWIKKRSWTRRP